MIDVPVDSTDIVESIPPEKSKFTQLSRKQLSTCVITSCRLSHQVRLYYVASKARGKLCHTGEMIFMLDKGIMFSLIESLDNTKLSSSLPFDWPFPPTRFLIQFSMSYSLFISVVKPRVCNHHQLRETLCATTTAVALLCPVLALSRIDLWEGW